MEIKAELHAHVRPPRAGAERCDAAATSVAQAQVEDLHLHAALLRALSSTAAGKAPCAAAALSIRWIPAFCSAPSWWCFEAGERTSHALAGFVVSLPTTPRPKTSQGSTSTAAFTATRIGIPRLDERAVSFGTRGTRGGGVGFEACDIHTGGCDTNGVYIASFQD